MTDHWDTFGEETSSRAKTLCAIDVERARADAKAIAARELNALTNENVRLAAELQRLLRDVNGGA